MNVRTLCLGILTFHEASGYEIKKMVEDDAFAHFIDASYGSIYPALTKMLKEGLVSVRAEEQAGKPDKKVYAITGKGRKELASALAVDPAKDKFKSEFLFQILLQEFLPPSHIADIYEAQVQNLRDELAKIDACVDDVAGHPGMNFVGGYGRASIEAGLKYLEENRHLVFGQTKPSLKVIEK
jgi:DNA-binding PadR family transcriptional regulator